MKQTGPASIPQTNQPSILHLPYYHHDQPNTSPDTCEQSLRSLPAEQVTSRLFRSACIHVRTCSRNNADTHIFKCDSYRPCSLCLRAGIDCVTTGRSAAASTVIAGNEASPSRARSPPQQHEETPNRRKRRRSRSRSRSRDDRSGTHVSASSQTTRNIARDSDIQSFATEDVRSTLYLLTIQDRALHDLSRHLSLSIMGAYRFWTTSRPNGLESMSQGVLLHNGENPRQVTC